MGNLTGGDSMTYTINKIAGLAGITLKTLRHYDKLGLLVPSGRSDAGYRLYSDEDVEKLQQILFFRELDFPLVRIKEIMDNPDYDRQRALEMQIEFLEERAKRYRSLSTLAKKTLKKLKGDEKMKNDEMFEGFDYDKIVEHEKKYEAEVKERWGETDAYKISKQRTDKYTKEDWERINNEIGANFEMLLRCFRENVPAESEEMMAVCDGFRNHITKNFYPCTLEIYSNLGNMYVMDERFTAYYDKYEVGLAKYYNDAIQYYCITKA